MANQTTRFGLNAFGGDVDGSILDDSGKYTGLDRQLLDLLLAAVEQHHHQFSAADEAGPSDAPTAVIGTSGSLSAGFDYSYVVSFVDDDGLETPAGDEVTGTTPDILVAPDAPSGETDTGGDLANGAYDYALTAVRDEEQSALGDLFTITLVDTDATVNLTLPALGEADSLNVWRRKDTEGGFTLIANTVLTSLIDLGAVTAYPCSTDPTYAPPSDNQGVDQYSFTVTLSAADQAVVQNYAGWRLYRTTTAGIYSAQSLVAAVVDRVDELDPESDLVTEWNDFGDALITGKPTLVDQRMHFEQFTFDDFVSLAAASGDHPANYPITVGGSLYVSDGIGSWIPIDELPTGGTTGQVLAKNSGADGDVEWVDMEGGSGGLIPGGTTGQVLAKNSGADGDVEWIDMTGGSTVFRGEHVDSDDYAVGDVVQYDADIFQALASSTGVYPERGLAGYDQAHVIHGGGGALGSDFDLAAQLFTPTYDMHITDLSFQFEAGGSPGSLSVELTDSIAPSYTPLATGTLAYDGTAGWVDVSLSVAVDLDEGVDYYIVIDTIAELVAADGFYKKNLTVADPLLVFDYTTPSAVYLDFKLLNSESAWSLVYAGATRYTPGLTVGSIMHGNTTRTSNITKTPNSNGGAFFSLPKYSIFAIDATIWASVESSAPGISWSFSYTATSPLSAVGYSLTADDGTSQIGVGGVLDADYSATFTAAADIRLSISGFFYTDSIEGDLTFDWAQESSSADDTTVSIGSIIKVTQI